MPRQYVRAVHSFRCRLPSVGVQINVTDLYGSFRFCGLEDGNLRRILLSESVEGEAEMVLTCPGYRWAYALIGLEERIP